MTKVGGIQKIMVLWQAVFIVALLLVTAPPSNLTRLCYNGSAAKSHPTTTQIIPPATQANNYKMLPIIVLLFIQNISSKLKTSLPLCKIPVVKHLPVFCQFQIMRGYNILADILQMVVFSVFVCYFKVFEGEVQEIL